MVWNNAVRIRDKMMVVVKEMARDGAKSNEKNSEMYITTNNFNHILSLQERNTKPVHQLYS